MANAEVSVERLAHFVEVLLDPNARRFHRHDEG